MLKTHKKVTKKVYRIYRKYGNHYNDVGRDQCTLFQSVERLILVRSDLPTQPAASSKKPGGFCKVDIGLAEVSRRAQRAKPAELV